MVANGSEIVAILKIGPKDVTPGQKVYGGDVALKLVRCTAPGESIASLLPGNFYDCHAR